MIFMIFFVSCAKIIFIFLKSHLFNNRRWHMLNELIVSGGCFWGVQQVFDRMVGVEDTQTGYTGGHFKNPTYEDVCSGKTGHAEAVKIRYNSSKVSADDLLDTFFQTHNPTTLNRQGADIGSQYRSALFYHTDEEKEQFIHKIKEFQPFFQQPIVTSLELLTVFYPAEDYHQHYFEKYTGKKCFNHNKFFDKNTYYRSKMSKERYHVMREKGTEPPYTGKYVSFDGKGYYRCGACGQPLFDSTAKFNSTCGWPSFDRSLPEAVKTKVDFSNFMIRNEVICSCCGSHLGHVFPDGPTITGNRYCINSIALDFNETPSLTGNLDDVPLSQMDPEKAKQHELENAVKKLPSNHSN